MKKMLLVIAGIAISTQAIAALDFFTGRQEMVTTVTYQQAWRCEYNYNGQMFYFIFQGSCPSSVQVQ